MKGVHLGELSKWSKLPRSDSKRTARVVHAMVEKRPRGEVVSRCNVTIMAVIISCGIARNGRKLRRSFTPPHKTKCPTTFAHIDGLLRWNP